MLDAGGGGGYAGTNWGDVDVKYMWSILENQNTSPHFDVVGGWTYTSDLVNEHLSRVTAYRNNLADVWPPSKSEASAAYIARIDELITHLEGTRDAADANYAAFSMVAVTMTTARNKLEPLIRQYEANEKLNLTWANEKAAADAKAKAATVSPSSTPTPSPSPSPSPVAPVAPVSAAQQEDLNRQARLVMFDLSSTIVDNHSALKAPTPYIPAIGEGETTKPKRTGTDNGGIGVPPVIPPPTAGSGGTPTRTANPANPNVTPVSPPANIPVGANPILPPTGTSPVVPPSGTNPIGGAPGGPVLGGVSPTPVLNPPSTIAPIPTPLPTTGTLPGTPIGGMPGLVTPGLVPTGLGGGGLPTGGLGKPGTVSTRMAMPSGGVIGATPGSGAIGQVPGAGSGGSRFGGAGRVNPVGGVIGQQGSMPGSGAGGRAGTGAGGVHGSAGGAGRQAGGARQGVAGQAGRSASGAHSMGQPGRSGSGGQQMMGQPGRSGRRQDGHEETSHWDPDNPWATDEGVDPVLMPPADSGPIDPGPAIGYYR
ncbi:hypothetical protein [Actinoplanes sp. NPDC051494]|uniref:hypothetical protein n=1 Tax=Actinoplanes sp. NPDC051494 TaxID=3363907 RepID=UPI0037B87291